MKNISVPGNTFYKSYSLKEQGNEKMNLRMETSFDFLIPDTELWNEYASLWKNSQYQSSFQSPRFLQLLVSLTSGPVAVLRGYRDETLIGLTIFFNKSGVYHFLSDLKTDHNYFILHKSITKEEEKKYFKTFLQEIEKQQFTFRLNNQPSWASYMDVFMETLAQSRLYGKKVQYNPCLVLEVGNTDSLTKATRGQKLRQKLNRLKEMGTVTFEAFSDTEDLDQWLEEFYGAHISRWANTLTPSSYRDPARRLFYKSCLLAWIKEGILVRFSIRLNEKRISFVTALLENGYLVHHTTTYDQNFKKQSPGLVIINMIGKWMTDRGMQKLEFGDGGESYKYQFTKNELPLSTIFITQKGNLFFIFKTELINFVRENSSIRNFYNNRIRPFLIRSKFLEKKIT